jgi:hypothetical protein
MVAYMSTPTSPDTTTIDARFAIDLRRAARAAQQEVDRITSAAMTTDDDEPVDRATQLLRVIRTGQTFVTAQTKQALYREALQRVTDGKPDVQRWLASRVGQLIGDTTTSSDPFDNAVRGAQRKAALQIVSRLEVHLPVTTIAEQLV